jgi:hypothetical protein
MSEFLEASLPFSFATKMYAFIVVPMRVTCPANLILDFVTLMIFEAKITN